LVVPALGPAVGLDVGAPPGVQVDPAFRQGSGMGADFRMLSAGLWHWEMEGDATAPGIRDTWSKPAVTRLAGSGE
jgi:hypothetical protein